MNRLTQLERNVFDNASRIAYKQREDLWVKNGSHGKESKAVGGFPFIPSSGSMIMRAFEIMKSIKLPKDAHILDAGCGVSPFLLSLKKFQYTNLFGMDLTQEYLDILKAEFGKFPITLICDNLLTTDFSKYDFIYSFMPLSHVDSYYEYRNNVFNTMHKHAIFFETYGPAGREVPKKLKEIVIPYRFIDYKLVKASDIFNQQIFMRK